MAKWQTEQTQNVIKAFNDCLQVRAEIFAACWGTLSLQISDFIHCPWLKSWPLLQTSNTWTKWAPAPRRSSAFQHSALQPFWVLVPSLQREELEPSSASPLRVHPALSWPVSREGPPNYPEPWQPGSPSPLHISPGVTYQPFHLGHPFSASSQQGSYVLWLHSPGPMDQSLTLCISNGLSINKLIPEDGRV